MLLAKRRTKKPLISITNRKDREVELAAVSFFSFFQFFSYKPGGFLREWGFVKGGIYFQMPLSALKSDEPQFFAPPDEAL